MSFKFAGGQAVEYRPAGGKAGLFNVIRQMPEEYLHVDRKYCIKSKLEGFERIVLECDLSEAQPEGSYSDEPLRRARAGRRPY